MCIPWLNLAISVATKQSLTSLAEQPPGTKILQHACIFYFLAFIFGTWHPCKSVFVHQMCLNSMQGL